VEVFDDGGKREFNECLVALREMRRKEAPEIASYIYPVIYLVGPGIAVPVSLAIGAVEVAR
jgi:hypothetical protein